MLWPAFFDVELGTHSVELFFPYRALQLTAILLLTGEIY